MYILVLFCINSVKLELFDFSKNENYILFGPKGVETSCECITPSQLYIITGSNAKQHKQNQTRLATL